MATSIESAKRNAANRAVAEHFDAKYKYVGIGSGSTIVYVVEAIKALKTDPSAIKFVPTGSQSRQVIVDAGLTPITFDSLPDDVLLDVAFDGADEVDEDLNCIKGGGACLYQEKLVAMQARKFVCVAGEERLFRFPFPLHLFAFFAQRLRKGYRRSPQIRPPPPNLLAFHPHRSRPPRRIARPARPPLSRQPGAIRPRRQRLQGRSTENRSGQFHRRRSVSDFVDGRGRGGRKGQGGEGEVGGGCVGEGDQVDTGRVGGGAVCGEEWDAGCG